MEDPVFLCALTFQLPARQAADRDRRLNECHIRRSAAFATAGDAVSAAAAAIQRALADEPWCTASPLRARRGGRGAQSSGQQCATPAAHFLTSRTRVEDGLLTAPSHSFGSFARFLAEKGLQHEADCLKRYERQGKSILRVSVQEPGEAFTAWVGRVGDPFSQGWDAIYQKPFSHDGVRGIADFLERVRDPETGEVSYEPVDAKLARVEAKPGHVLQLCFYADAIEAVTGIRPRRMHLWLGSGRFETLVVGDFRPYWNRLRKQLAQLLAEGPANSATVPAPWQHAHCVRRRAAQVGQELLVVAPRQMPLRPSFEAGGHARVLARQKGA